jgi:transposase-like protein
MTTENVRRSAPANKVARRRRYSLDFKLKVVQEANAPGANTLLVAQHNKISPSQVRDWRSKAERGRLGRRGAQKLIRVQPVGDSSLQQESRADIGSLGAVAARGNSGTTVVIVPVPISNWAESLAALIRAVREPG